MHAWLYRSCDKFSEFVQTKPDEGGVELLADVQVGKNLAFNNQAAVGDVHRFWSQGKEADTESDRLAES